MEDLTKLMGSDLGFSVARFLSTHGETTFQEISDGFRRQFRPETRVIVAISIAHVLRRRPESTTSSARIIGIYVLYDAFAFKRPMWQHVFGPVFVVLLRNDPLPWSNGLQPLGEAERIFLLHLLAVSTEALAERTPRELLITPERMVERINAERYQEQVICYAMRTLDVRPLAMYGDPSIRALIDRLTSVPLPTDSVKNVDPKSHYQQCSSGVSEEEMAFHLLYRRIMLLLFPLDESFFLPGGLVPYDIFNGDETYAKYLRIVEEGNLLSRLPKLAKWGEERSCLPHEQSAGTSSCSRPVADWKCSSDSASAAPGPVTSASFTRTSPKASSCSRPPFGNSASFVRPTVSKRAKPEADLPIKYVGVRQIWWSPADLMNPSASRVHVNPVFYSYVVREPPAETSTASQASGQHGARKTPINRTTESGQYRTTTKTVTNNSRDGSSSNSENKSLGISQSSLSKKMTKNKKRVCKGQIRSPLIENTTSSQKLCSLSDSDKDYLERLDSEHSSKSPCNCPSLASPVVERPTSSFGTKGCCISEGKARQSRYATSDSAEVLKNGKAGTSTSSPGDSETENDGMTLLVHRATVVTLAMGGQQRLLQLFEKRTDDGLISAVDENAFESLINLNPLLAVYIFCRLVSAGRAQKYYQRVLDMDVSLNVLDVVNRVVTAMFMPVDFLCDFLCKCYSTYVNVPTNDQSPYKRIVTLIISFTDSLFQRRMIDPTCIRCEALHFCISHSNLSQALALYRKLKSEEHV
ncbi:DUF2363 domain containing protein [Trichuris trichiura]|uniref:CCR4-NOT transcription complex subunit 11 n=1 Tax=Trichuris trichiura TaxID=36087 RepID=A0A077YY45_TRITR|nr:DUF2363 domain containing protein [Trichuris trichiura]